MDQHGIVLFETPIGTCGMAWLRARIAAVQLPEAGSAATEGRLRRRFPDAATTEPPAEIGAVIRAVRSLLEGAKPSLQDAQLDERGLSDFESLVYAATRLVLPGETSTYGRIASQIGRPGEARAVGQALGRNPFPIVVPCHRILGADGKAGGFSGAGGVATKLRMLTIEQATTRDQPTLFGGADWPLAARNRNPS